MKINEAKLEWLENPEVFRINQIDAHSDHMFYTNKQDALEDNEMKLKQSLNGMWYINYAKNQDDRIKQFYEMSYDCRHFDMIEVPSHIQLHGYDKIHYINTLYPWDGKEFLRPPSISKVDNPVASYTTYFELKDTLKNYGEYHLAFEGVETAYYVWLNGIFVGYAEDSFTTSTFDVSTCIKEGENKLCVEVYKRSSASWLEDQDFFRFSGIFRDVNLYAIPAIHIQDIFITSVLKDNFQKAAVSIDVTEIHQRDVNVEVEIYDPHHKLISTSMHFISNDIQLQINDAMLWSAEDPNLYKAVISIFDEKQNIIEVVAQPFGLREFVMKDGVMTLNGKRIIFNGINRHEFSSKRGRSIKKEDMLFDIQFLKKHNINAVRTSHYPNQSAWYKLCDEYGIYVMDEANLESHGSWQKLSECEASWNVPGNYPEWKEVVVDRARNMLERDKNHPSILIYSCGNESYAGTNIQAMSTYFHERDKTRLVHYEGSFWNRDYDDISDMESRMYAKPIEIEKYLKSNPTKPYISCEYMHAMGNSLGGLSHYTDLISKYEQYQGGFIWDYIDQAIEHKDQYGKTALGYGGDFKDRYTDYNFSGNGIVFADRKISPKASEVKYRYQDIQLEVFDDKIKVINNFLFTNTSNYEFVYYIKSKDRILEERILDVDVEPLQSKEISLKAPSFSFNYTITVSVRLKHDTIWANKGYEIAFGQLQRLVEDNTPIATKELHIVEGDGNIGISCKNFSALFALPEGLVSLRYNDEEYIVRAPRPIFAHASTDNERGYKFDVNSSIWFSASTFYNCTDVKYDIKETKDQVKIAYTYTLPTFPITTCDLVYTITYPGVIQVDCHYYGEKGLPQMSTFGVLFKLYSSFDTFSYLGRGPYENYADRKYGSKLDYYSSLKVKDNLTPYLVPQENGSRCDVQTLQVYNQQQGIAFSYIDKPFSANVQPYSMQQLESVLHKEELGDIYTTYVTIMEEQMGVGGDDSWGAPVYEQYCISAEEDRHFCFILSEREDEK